VDLKVYPSTSGFAAMVVAHGAGAGQKSPFMVRVAAGLAERGIAAATFDFPYMVAGRSVPDRAPVLEAAWREAIERARPLLGDLPLFIGGKSMGGRIASHVASQAGAGPLQGLVFFGYPLHPPGKPQQTRDAHLPAIAEPMLFIQGSKDPFGTAAEIRALVPKLPRATLHEIADGDHSFKVPKRQGSPEAIMTGIMDGAASWMRSIAEKPGG
jgi:predicted alpha/beta-hydrolase family hydrolase